MTFNYTRNWVKLLVARGYKEFKFADLPDDLRIYALHRKAIAQGLVRRTGFYHGPRNNRTVSIWKVVYS